MIENLEEFENKYKYSGELGAIYLKSKTRFVLWAPTALNVKIVLYKDGCNSGFDNIFEMVRNSNGVWAATIKGDLNGVYYNYLVTSDKDEVEVTDPYAKAVGVNGNRGMVIDLKSTNPSGFDKDIRPDFIDATDAVIYEMHIRDFTIHASSGIPLEDRGKYNGLWKSSKLENNKNIKTGINHLKELGVTHVHLLPTFDYNSIDESRLYENKYNWGYDPKNYNVPEGSYSSNPYRGEIRIKEFKNMIKKFHNAKIRVVMDMVFNHTSQAIDSNFNLAVPGYYYRQDESGTFYNGSGCGNETASERIMFRKFMVDCVAYWATEYHIDGFRFDLMALHDIDTMVAIRNKLDEIDKSILIYGEGWTGGYSPLLDDKKALKINTVKYGELQIAAFSDDMRDIVKGHVFEKATPGFINGFLGLEEVIKSCIVAATKQSEVKYGTGINQYSCYGRAAWANEPYQVVNYVSAHDNLTLWDKLQSTNKAASREEIISLNKMAAAIVLTSQGIPFFQAGEEMARTKVNEDGTLNDNSYNASDKVNAIDWNRKEEYIDLFNYYKGLIQLRKLHKVFRMNKALEIEDSLTFLKKGKNFDKDNIVAYKMDGTVVSDSFNHIVVIFNANESEVKITLPTSRWIVIVNEKYAGVNKLDYIDGDTITVPAKSSYVLVDYESFNKSIVKEVRKF